MIKRIHIKNFKSLRDFKLDLSSTTCLIGLNGSGKSTLLQAFSFLSSQMTGTVGAWLKERHWEAADLKSYGSASSIIDFEIEIEISREKSILWNASFNSNSHFLRCTKELVQLKNTSDADETILLKVSEGKVHIHDKGVLQIVQKYEGSILSSLFNTKLPAECLTLREELVCLRSFDLLNPQAMRIRSRADGTLEIGIQGDRLAAAIHQLSKEEKAQKLLPTLQKFFPSVNAIESRKTVGGWIELIVEEIYGARKIRTLARHCPDGLLRMLAILTQLMFSKGIVCFDEVENGISADLLTRLLTLMREQPKQIILTTHSVTALNFIREEEVRLLYRNHAGETCALPYIHIPNIQEYRLMYDVGDAVSIASLQAMTDSAKGASDVSI